MGYLESFGFRFCRSDLILSGANVLAKPSILDRVDLAEQLVLENRKK